MFQGLRRAAANLQASTDLLHALVEASANEQKVFNAALPTLVEETAKLQGNINAMLPALVAGSANTQNLIQHLIVRLDAQMAQIAAATGAPAPKLTPVPKLAPMPGFGPVTAPSDKRSAQERTMFAERLDAEGVAIIREFFDPKEA